MAKKKNLRFFRMNRLVISFRYHTEKISYRRVSIASYFTDFLNKVNSISTTNFSLVFKECAKQGALELGKQAHGHMILSGFLPTTFVLNCLLQVYINSRDLVSASMLFDKMPVRDVVSWNTMINGYRVSNNMVKASEFFKMMPLRDVVSWNSMLSGYLHNGESLKSIEVFVDMIREGISFDDKSFAIVLKVCSCLGEYSLGIQIHGIVVRVGYDTDVVAASALLDMYAKCKRFDESLSVFRGMSVKNSVSWSAMIAGCVQNNLLSLALKLFKEMLKKVDDDGCGVSQSIYASVLRSCAALSELRLGGQLHAHALKTDFAADGIVRTATLDMYAKCDNMEDAQILFDKSENLNLQSYNAMITGYSQDEHGFKALSLFRRLMLTDLGFDEISLSGVFRACALVKGLSKGLQVYGLAIKSNLSKDVCVANAAIDMFGKCQALVEAFRVFDEMRRRDAVSWNAIIAANEQNGKGNGTLSLFVSMLRSGTEPDEFTFGSVLKACTGNGNYGMEIHSSVVKSGMATNSAVGCSLIDMYSKCGMIEEAEKIHNRLFLQSEELEKMNTKRLQEQCVSWNSIISGYVNQKQSEDAQIYFTRMMETGVTPDKFTYATVLDSCANLASAGLGKQIHAQVIKKELQSDVYICSTLVDMYSKCGDLEDSRLMFEKSRKNRDFVTWNAMICGYAHHGKGEEAIKLFERMINHENIKPNHVTFISILRACAHMGLIEKALEYFDSMKRDYGLEPQLPHYSNMVDILGKSGRIKKALTLIQEMPFEADDVIWRTLLGVCILHRDNVEIAEEAARELLRLDPGDSSTYTLLSNVYADAGMWEKVSDLRRSMRGFKVKKEPGCSWVEIKDELHVFLVGDKAHPKYEEIYDELELIYSEMKPNFGDCFMELEVEEEVQEQWC